MNLAAEILGGSMFIAIPISILAGLVSFLSPCVLPLVPGYLGFVSGNAAPKSRIVLGTVLFVLGFTSVFISLGTIFGVFGARLHAYSFVIQPILGAVVILLGLVMVGQFSFMQRTIKPNWRPRMGLVGAPLLGIVFGLGWTPCIGPTLSVVLTLALNEGSAARGGLLAFCYAIGLGLPFLAFAASFTTFAPHFEWLKRHQRALQRAGGGLLIVVGISMVTGLWAILVAYLRQWASTFGTIL